MSILGLAFALPVLWCAGLVFHRYLRLPVGDYWDVLYAAYTLRDSGALEQLRYLFEPFVDQLMVLPKLLIVSLARATDNRHYIVELALGFALQLAVLAIMLIFIRARDDLGRRAQQGLAAGAAAILFWPAQIERFVNPWYSSQYALVLLPAMLALLLLWRNWGRWSGLLGGGVAALCSGLAHGTGLLFLPAAALVLTMQKGWNRAQLWCWWLFSAGVFAAVSAGRPARAELGFPPLTAALEQPAAAGRFFLRTFSPTFWGAAVGAFLLSLTLWAAWRLHRAGALRTRAAFPWLAIATWAVLVAAATTVSRFAPGRGPNGIYISFFVVFYLSVLVLVVSALRTLDREPLRRAFAVVLSLAFAAIYIQGARVGLRDSSEWRRQMEWTIERLAFFNETNADDLRWIFPPDQPRFRERMLPLLRRWGTFAEVIDDRPLARRERVEFSRHCNGLLELVPDRPLLRDEVLAIAGSPTALERLTLEWDTGTGWNEQQTAALAGRFHATSYRVVFHERTETGRTDAITRVRLAGFDAHSGPCRDLIARDFAIEVWSR